MTSVEESKTQSKVLSNGGNANKKSLSLQQRLQMQMEQRRKKQLLKFKERARRNETNVGTSLDRSVRFDSTNRATGARKGVLSLSSTVSTQMRNQKPVSAAHNLELTQKSEGKGSEETASTEGEVNAVETKKEGRPLLNKFRQKAQEIRTVMRVLNSFRNVSTSWSVQPRPLLHFHSCFPMSLLNAHILPPFSTRFHLIHVPLFRAIKN